MTIISKSNVKSKKSNNYFIVFLTAYLIPLDSFSKKWSKSSIIKVQGEFFTTINKKFDNLLSLTEENILESNMLTFIYGNPISLAIH